MIKIVTVVSDLLSQDQIALEAMRSRTLNFRAYAERILPRVEKIAMKPVKKGSIVVALSRLAKSTKFAAEPLQNTIKLENIEVKSGLIALTYERTPDLERKASVLYPFQVSSTDLFALSETPNHITLILSERSREKVLKHFDTPLVSEKLSLVAITIHMSPMEKLKAHFFYTLFATLAAKRIIIEEVVSSPTEISCIVKKDQMETALTALNIYS